jgi:hypothetical protein
MLLLVLIPAASHVLGANDELLVDPTAPLTFASSVGVDIEDEEGGGLFGIDLDFGAFDELLTSYELSSVLIRSQDRIAVINGERARIGDKIGSATVTSIEANRVTLDVDGKTETLELYKNSIKTLVKGDE